MKGKENLPGGLPRGNAILPAKARGKLKTAPIVRISEGRNRKERREIARKNKGKGNF